MKKFNCAHCGSELTDAKFGAELLSVEFTRAQTLVLRRLIEARGSVVSIDQLVHALYGDRADGGPLSAEKTAKQHVYFLKHRVRRKGWDIRNIRGFGYRLIQSNVIYACFDAHGTGAGKVRSRSA